MTAATSLNNNKKVQKSAIEAAADNEITTTTPLINAENNKMMNNSKTEMNHIKCLNNISTTTTSATKAQNLKDFYANKTILITGATGFIGKVCLVKLIKSLGTCKRVYVMLRPKRGLTPQQRFNKMLNEPPFSNDKQQQTETTKKDNNNCVDHHHHHQQTTDNNVGQQLDWSKVVAVEGDMSCEWLGFSEEVRETMNTTVDIIFNIAASVQFDAPLKQNLRDNYIGVKNLLQLALDFERLISFVHVSTFFTNSHMSHVEEKVVPMNRDCEKMAELISWIPDSLCDSIAPQVMENRPNTYIFTKAMAENLVQKHQGRLPLAIVRPSIVTPSVREPTPGWVDNVNGPMGLGTLASLGILRNIDWNYDGVADMIPVDYVVNTMLAVAERTPRLYPNEIKVYNCSSSSLNPMTWGNSFEVLRSESFKAPPYKMLRIPITVPRHKRANPIAFKLTKLSEIMFAYFIDFILTICGQKPVLTKLTSKLHHGYEILKPFTTTEYTCSNDNLLAAYEELRDKDKQEFEFDVRALDWQQGFVDSYYGARSRLLKEDISNVPAALFKMKILWFVEQVFKVMMLALVGWNSYRLYGYVSQQFMSS